jgi:GntR family transcriptional regulator, regulator for abcA and norABC
LEWNLDRSNDKPLYKQIADFIERRISYGELPAGTILPSERELAKRLKVNRSTVVAAYEELRASGLIESRIGSGTRVSKDIWGIARKRIPNWRKYIEAGVYLPNLPLVRRIFQETRDHDLIDMGSGELSSHLFPDAAFRKLMSQKEFNGYLGYEDSKGNLALRETIAAHVLTYRNIHATPSSILITSGAQQAIHLIVHSLLSPGDAVAIEDPSYCYSLQLFKSAGIRTFHLPVDEHGVNPDDIIALQKKHGIRMIFLNPNFQNPTGTVLSQERRKAILSISSEYGIPIVEDDPYSLISMNGKSVPSLKSEDSNGTVLYVSSLSKIVASGLRIGWIIGPQTVIERLADVKQQVDFGHSIFPQWIANQFMASDDFDSHLLSLRQELKVKRDLLVASLKQELPDEADFYIPDGGIHLWCKLHPAVNDYALLEVSMQRGVVFVPGSVLGSKQGYVRFTFGRTETSCISEGIKRFAEALRVMMR